MDVGADHEKGLGAEGRRGLHRWLNPSQRAEVKKPERFAKSHW
jgi:hypothetical protein